jgi:hypothetical protein
MNGCAEPGGTWETNKERRLGFRGLERVFGNFILLYFYFLGLSSQGSVLENLGREEGPVPNAEPYKKLQLGFDWVAKTFAGDPQQIQATLPRTEVSTWPIPRPQTQPQTQPQTTLVSATWHWHVAWAMHPGRAMELRI